MWRPWCLEATARSKRSNGDEPITEILQQQLVLHRNSDGWLVHGSFRFAFKLAVQGTVCQVHIRAQSSESCYHALHAVEQALDQTKWHVDRQVPGATQCMLESLRDASSGLNELADNLLIARALHATSSPSALWTALVKGHRTALALLDRADQSILAALQPFPIQ